MYRKKMEADIRCPLEYGLKVFGGKWKSRVICVLNEKGVLRYSAIRKEMLNVTDAVLSSTLKELINDGLVARKQYDEIPPRVEYSLTDRGKSVVPILQKRKADTHWKELSQGRRLHDLRHTAATEWLRHGIDVLTVKEWLGHSSLAVTQRYVHYLGTDADIAAIKKLNW